MNENKKQCCHHNNQKTPTQNNENIKELEKMKEVISVEAGQNQEITKDNKENQNKN